MSRLVSLRSVGCLRYSLFHSRVRLRHPLRPKRRFPDTLSSSASSFVQPQLGSVRTLSLQADEVGILTEQYHDLVSEKDVQPDPHQLSALGALERLREDLLQTDPASTDPSIAEASKSSFSSGLFGGFLGKASPAVKKAVSLQKAPRGVYLHGGVGCGKTFLMNLFYDSLLDGPWAQEKQKVHFHKFMLRIHQDMHAARYSQNGAKKSDAILPAVIAKTIEKGRLLCLDEFQVTDVADALILQRLFTGLWDHGCVVVATSNRPPDELYWNGLQRDRFLPFIELIKEECEVVSMWDSDTDYRLIQKMTSGTGRVYFIGRESHKEFDDLFYELVNGSPVAPTSLQTQGRKVKIPQAALKRCIARFTFEDLCKKALGAADYLIIGQNFHTVFVEKIPQMTLNELNWLRRFITFVDSMYECNVKLVLQAKTPAVELLKIDQKTEHDEVFAFDRTVSRLDEMSSQKYLQKRWERSSLSESKAMLLSQKKASLDVVPSLGDATVT